MTPILQFLIFATLFLVAGFVGYMIGRRQITRQMEFRTMALADELHRLRRKAGSAVKSERAARFSADRYRRLIRRPRRKLTLEVR